LCATNLVQIIGQRDVDFFGMIDAFKQVDVFHVDLEPIRPAFALRATADGLRPSIFGWLASRSPKGEGWWSRGDLNP
jgi:hypothetical protein